MKKRVILLVLVVVIIWILFLLQHISRTQQHACRLEIVYDGAGGGCCAPKSCGWMDNCPAVCAPCPSLKQECRFSTLLNYILNGK